MKEHNSISRRMLVRSSFLGLLAANLPNIVFAKNIEEAGQKIITDNYLPHDRYPAIPLDVASEVVGVSHFNLDRLKELVGPRPELARANWDWGFGDWESAIGAASHVGRRDIVDYLVSKGAVPTIFTYAILGDHDTVKRMIEAYPGIQRNPGPHGITLMQHAKTGLQTEGVDKAKAQQLVTYLEVLGEADGKEYLKTEETEMAKYVGDYKYGDGKEDGFTIKVNSQKMLSIGRLGKTGGTLLRTREHEFIHRAAPSVSVLFIIENGKVLSLTLREPGLTLTATRI